MNVKVAKIDDEELTSSALDLRFIPYSKTREEFQLDYALNVAIHRELSAYPEVVGGYCRSTFVTIYEQQGVFAVESGGNESNLLVSSLAEYISITHNGANEQYQTSFLTNDYGHNFRNDCLSTFTIILPHQAFRFAPCLIDNSLAFALNKYNRLYISTDGTYIFSEEEFSTGDKIVNFKLAADEDDIKTIESFVGFYAPAIFFNIPPDLYDAVVNVSAIPSEYRFSKNSGIHEILESELSVEVTFDGEPWEVSFRTFVSPVDSGVTKELVATPNYHYVFVVDTDSNLVNEFKINYSLPRGLYNVATEIYIIDESEPEPNPNPYNPGGVSRPGGGGGSFNVPESDDVSVDVPLGTDIGNDSSTGMYTRYLMNTQYMKLFGYWMWDPDAGLSLIKTLYESWYGEKQSDSLISLLSFPFALTAPLTGISSHSQPLVLGHQNIIANYIALKSGGAQIDWGTLNLQEYWGNFLDYSPHTKIELYLPWGTGFVDIDPGQCLPGTLKVVTNIEFARGSCTHNVINQDGCVLGTYMGQPGSMVPMIASDIASKRAGMLVGAVAAGVGGVVAGGAAAVSAIGQSASVAAYTQSMSRLPMTMPASTRSSIATNIASQPLNVANEISSNLMPGATLAKHIASDAAIASRRHPAHMTRNGGFGDASAGTMIQYPYLIISRPEQNVPDSYGHHYGYPSNIYEPLANLRGYTEIAAIHLNGIGCTASEMSELESILAGGVIF